MNKYLSRRLLLMYTFRLVLLTSAQAGTLVWTFTPLTPTAISVPVDGTAIVRYTVTNQSNQSKNLLLQAMPGLSASSCQLATKGSMCTLMLTVNGRAIPPAGIHTGPILCEQGNPNQCYRPSSGNELRITSIPTPPVTTVTVTASVSEGNGSITPNGPETVTSGASLTFTATPDSGYGVNQWLVDGTPVQTGGTTYQLNTITASHTVTVTFGTVTLTPSVSTLGLSVNCRAGSSCAQTNADLTGVARQITITNTGSGDATHVVVSQAGLPSDVLVSPSSCGTIAANGGQCVIRVTPGATASSDASGALCTTGVEPQGHVNVTADGGLLTSVNTYVLSYGCIYQEGYIFAIDDTTSTSASIGGTTAALNDNASSIQWFNGSNVTTTAQDLTDGATNTATIISKQGMGSYAAETCANYTIDSSGNSPCSTGTCYSNWYLPAICQIGASGKQAGCLPGTANMVSNLPNLIYECSGSACLLNSYWSSTETSVNPVNAWFEDFNTTHQGYNRKNNVCAVRCSRALTP